MFLPDPLIFSKPLHIWLGILTYLLIVLQIGIGTRLIKLPFWVHTRIVWIALLAIATIHMIYGISIYFF